MSVRVLTDEEVEELHRSLDEWWEKLGWHIKAAIRLFYDSIRLGGK